MSIYDKNKYNASLNSIARRLGINNYQEPSSEPLYKPFYDYNKEEQFDGTGLTGLENQFNRLGATGGFAQQERMIYDKRRSLDRALVYSYHGANIIKIREYTKELLDPKPLRALINPNKLKQDYDDKILSVPYEANFKVGDIFEWLGTNTKWIIYLQDLTELAYFKGDIRKCNFEISWKDENGEIQNTYAAIRGPVETKIDYIQKHGISVDTPNHSLNILMPKNEKTLKYFKRYSKFYLKDSEVCWRVEALDWISMEGILEINAVEYYANVHEDDKAIVGDLLVETKDENSMMDNAAITGDTFIKPKATYEYRALGSINGEWKIDSKYPICMTVDKDNPKICRIEWLKGISGQFDLSYGKYTKTIVVESLF